MRTDYLNEVMNDIRAFNDDILAFKENVQHRVRNLNQVRDKLNDEITRLEKIAHGLGQLAAQNGAEAILTKDTEILRSGGSIGDALRTIDEELDVDDGPLKTTTRVRPAV